MAGNKWARKEQVTSLQEHNKLMEIEWQPDRFAFDTRQTETETRSAHSQKILKNSATLLHTTYLSFIFKPLTYITLRLNSGYAYILKILTVFHILFIAYTVVVANAT